MQVLLACRADPVSQHYCLDMTSMHAAAQYYSEHPTLTEIPILKAILESRPAGPLRDALVSKVCTTGHSNSVLGYAAGSTAAVAYLLSAGVIGASVRRRMLQYHDARGRNPLHCAITEHNVDACKLLRAAKARLE